MLLFMLPSPSYPCFSFTARILTSALVYASIHHRTICVHDMTQLNFMDNVCGCHTSTGFVVTVTLASSHILFLPTNDQKEVWLNIMVSVKLTLLFAVILLMHV